MCGHGENNEPLWTGPAPQPGSAWELEVLEAVLRFWIAHSPAATGSARWSFVGIAGDRDPHPDLLKLLADVSPPVCAISSSDVRESDRSAIPVRRGTDEEGIQFVVRNLQRVPGDVVIADVAYYQSVISAAEAILWLRQQQGRWAVTHAMLLWIA